MYYSKAYNYLDALKRRGYNPRQRGWGRCSLTNCPHIFGLYYNIDEGETCAVADGKNQIRSTNNLARNEVEGGS